MATWSTNPTDEYNDLESACETTLSCDAFLGSLTYTLTAACTKTAASISFDTTGLPDKGSVKIGDERILYTGKTGTTITGCTRGTHGTTAAAHADSSTVTTYNVAYIFTELLSDQREYPDNEMPAISIEVTGSPDDERATFARWDHNINFEVWVTCRDTDYGTAAEDCKLLTSEVRRLFRIQSKANNSLQDLLDEGDIFVGPTEFSRPDAGHWDGSRWWKTSRTQIRIYHEETE